MKSIELSDEVVSLIETVGREAFEDHVLRTLKVRGLVGKFTAAGLTLPEVVANWAGGGVAVTLQGKDVVITRGPLKLVQRRGSRQGICQANALKNALWAAGVLMHDTYTYTITADVCVGRWQARELTAAEILADEELFKEHDKLGEREALL